METLKRINENDVIRRMTTVSVNFVDEANLLLPPGVRSEELLFNCLGSFGDIANPRVVGQILSELTAREIDFNADARVFWAEVAAHMQGIGIDELMKRASFMKRVQGFDWEQRI